MKYKRIKVEDADIIIATKEVTAHEYTIQRLSLAMSEARMRAWNLIEQKYPDTVGKKAQWDGKTNEIVVPIEDEGGE